MENAVIMTGTVMRLRLDAIFDIRQAEKKRFMPQMTANSEPMRLTPVG
jgi:hypothetical protein